VTIRQYATIVADPPWEVAAGRSIGRYEPRSDGSQAFGVTDNSARPLAYPSMTVDAIKALPVRDLAAADSHLYLWTTNGYLEAAFSVAKAWGFRPTTTLVWAKNVMGGGLGGAFGISTEFCLFCRRGSLRTHGRIGGTWFNWKRPYKDGYPRHSAKPPEFITLVEEVSPGPYLELFARDKRDGWHAWGNEVASDIAMMTEAA
jgi:N6-adenosine-specific RNA methylase IME4